MVLALWGLTLVELSLLTFRKIPFTCSYLPGRSNVNRAFWLCILVMVILLTGGAIVEQNALERPRSYVMLLLALAGAVYVARRRANERAKHEVMVFEQEPIPAIITLGLGPYSEPPSAADNRTSAS